jgi:SAM-dependent methyltransferase
VSDASADWWRTFFSGPVVEIWLQVPTAEQTRQEADFIQEALQVKPPVQLLDVPCGGGRHCHELAGRGFGMTGVDIAPEFLAAARSISHQAGAVAWEQRAMRDLPWTDRFDGAYCFGNSFGYDDEAGNAGFLKSVARALKPGARFALEACYVVEVVLPTLQERSWYEVGDQIVLSQRRYDPATSRLHVEFTFIRGGAVERRVMSARIYSFREIHRLMEEAGFTDLEGYGSLTREPFKLGSARLLMIGTSH